MNRRVQEAGQAHTQSKRDHVLHRMSQEAGKKVTVRTRAVVTRFSMITRSGEPPPWWTNERHSFAVCSWGSGGFEPWAADDVTTRLGHLQVLVDEVQKHAIQIARPSMGADKHLRDALYDRSRTVAVEAVWAVADIRRDGRALVTGGDLPDDVIDGVQTLRGEPSLDAGLVAAALVARMEGESAARAALEYYSNDVLTAVIDEARPAQAPEGHRPSVDTVRGVVQTRLAECAKMNQRVDQIDALVLAVAQSAWYPPNRSPYFLRLSGDFWEVATSSRLDRQISKAGVRGKGDVADVKHDAIVEAARKAIHHIHRAECGLVEDATDEAMNAWFVKCLSQCVKGAVATLSQHRSELRGTVFDDLEGERPIPTGANPLADALARDKTVASLPPRLIRALFDWAHEAMYATGRTEILGLLAEMLEAAQGDDPEVDDSPWIARARKAGENALHRFIEKAGSGKGIGGEM